MIANTCNFVIVAKCVCREGLSSISFKKDRNICNSEIFSCSLMANYSRSFIVRKSLGSERAFSFERRRWGLRKMSEPGGGS